MKISGVKKIKLKKFKNKKGDLLKFISRKDKIYKKFGEIYFTEVKKELKGWNYHKRNTCLLAVPYGKVEFNLVDGRHKEINFKKKLKIYIGKKEYYLLVIPPKIWFSFKSVSRFSLVANLIKNPHNNLEIKKKIIEHD